jgi:hypothetical protein
MNRGQLVSENSRVGVFGKVDLLSNEFLKFAYFVKFRQKFSKKLNFTVHAKSIHSKTGQPLK